MMRTEPRRAATLSRALVRWPTCRGRRAFLGFHAKRRCLRCATAADRLSPARRNSPGHSSAVTSVGCWHLGFPVEPLPTPREVALCRSLRARSRTGHSRTPHSRAARRHPSVFRPSRRADELRPLRTPILRCAFPADVPRSVNLGSRVAESLSGGAIGVRMRHEARCRGVLRALDSRETPRLCASRQELAETSYSRTVLYRHPRRLGDVSRRTRAREAPPAGRAVTRALCHGDLAAAPGSWVGATDTGELAFHVEPARAGRARMRHPTVKLPSSESSAFSHPDRSGCDDSPLPDGRRGAPPRLSCFL